QADIPLEMGYTYSATITYDSSATPWDISVQAPDFEVAEWLEAILSVEYSVCDQGGSPVLSDVEMGDGGFSNSTIQVNDLGGRGSDFVDWNLQNFPDGLFGSGSAARVRIWDDTSEWVAFVQDYPAPPVLEQIATSVVDFIQRQNSGGVIDGYWATGSIGEISEVYEIAPTVD